MKYIKKRKDEGRNISQKLVRKDESVDAKTYSTYCAMFWAGTHFLYNGKRNISLDDMEEDVINGDINLPDHIVEEILDNIKADERMTNKAKQFYNMFVSGEFSIYMASEEIRVNGYIYNLDDQDGSILSIVTPKQISRYR
jgi:hypothetical protein